MSLSFIENLLKRYRTDGTVEPRAHGGGKSTKLSLEQEAVIATLVEQDNDAILVELCDRLEQRVGVRISRATMGHNEPRHLDRSLIYINVSAPNS